jgi:hypothetical protein
MHSYSEGDRMNSQRRISRLIVMSAVVAGVVVGSYGIASAASGSSSSATTERLGSA